MRRVSKEKVSNQIERWLTLEEEEKLLSSSPKWLQQIMIFVLNTGLRKSEILNLRWPQVDLSRKTFSILEQKNKGKDTLPLNNKAFAILEERKKARNGKIDLVFSSRKGTKINPRNLLSSFYSFSQKAKISKLRFHDLRHTFATRLAQEGVDLYKVQKLGRWKNISMVTRYAHHYPESLRSGVEILDRIGSKSITNLAQSHDKGATLAA